MGDRQRLSFRLSAHANPMAFARLKNGTYSIVLHALLYLIFIVIPFAAFGKEVIVLGNLLGNLLVIVAG